MKSKNLTKESETIAPIQNTPKTLNPKKRELLISFIMRFSDELGDYFYDLGNDDLEHHLESLSDRQLVKVYKEIKEEFEIKGIGESKNIQEDTPSIDGFVEKIKKLFKSYGLNILEKRMFRNDDDKYVVVNNDGENLFKLSLNGEVLTLTLIKSNNILNKQFKPIYNFELNNTFEVNKLKEHLKRTSDLLLKYPINTMNESKKIKLSEVKKIVDKLVKESLKK